MTRGAIDTEVAREPGAEGQNAQQYIRLWRIAIRTEVLILAGIAAFAVSIAVAFLALGLGEDDITGGWGYPMLALISLLRASSVVLPIPGSGLTIVAGAVMDPLWFIPVPIAVGVTAGASESLGEFTGYYAGLNGGKLMEGRKIYQRIRTWIEKAPFPTMFAMSFMPSPLFDVAGLAAGAARVPIRIFYPAILLGKIGRGTVMAAAGYYGADLVTDVLHALELKGASGILDSPEGKALVGAGAIVGLAVAFYLFRRFRGQLSEWF
jgi:uncharacterized membrane protein YdjX (TVP38/TMEM64 family)